MLNLFFIVSIILLLIIAICGLISYRPQNIATTGLYWLCSWLAQSFSPQLGLACLLLLISSLNANASFLISACSVVSLFMYVLICRRGQSTQAVIEPIINAAIKKLGFDSAASTFNSPTTKNTKTLGLRPLNYGRASVKRIKNIAYGPHGKSNLLDIYQPLNADPNKAMPVLIQVPGGAWVTGSKNDQGLPLLHHMAACGWTCFSINYRLGPDARFPAMLEDVLRAIAWVKIHAADYGANPNFIALTGGSAGGHLTSLAALVRDRSALQPGFEEIDTHVDVAVPIYGRYDFLNQHKLLPKDGLEPFLTAKVMPSAPSDCPELWQLACPDLQVHADAPPFLIFHGSADAMIPVEEARIFASALEGVSKQAVDYIEVPNAQHGYDIFRSSWAMPTVSGIARYLNAHYGNHLKAQHDHEQS